MPTIFDIVDNIDNLQGIGALQEEMAAAQEKYASRGEKDKIAAETFSITDEAREARELFRQLGESLTADWDEMHSAARAYHAEHGDLKAPKRHKTTEGLPLGAWLAAQRASRRANSPDPQREEHEAQLDALGMEWDASPGAAWERGYAAAKEYRNKHGDLDVPARHKENGTNLGTWLSAQRAARRAHTHNEQWTQREQRLDEIGMIWDVRQWRAERNAAAAAQYETHRGKPVPARYITEDGRTLGRAARYARSAAAGR
jgi:hypothetical protein